MMSIRTVALACITTAMMAMPLAASAQTGPRSQDTYFTFSQKVELPNVTLPAGTYLFQLADSEGNRHIVRVLSRDRQKLYTTLMAIPAYSMDRPPDKPEIRFMESPATQANAIKIWFYPGNTVGHEFIYPRNQALKLAKASGESVLTTKSEKAVSSTVADNDLTRVNPQGQDVETNMSGQHASARARSEVGSMEAPSSTQTASAQAPASQQSTPPATPPPAASSASNRQTATPGATGTSGTTATATRTRRALPRTAGVLPLIGLIGLGSLAGSRIVRRTRRA